MKKFNWLLVMLLLALVPALQSCDDDGYSIGDIGWDWATVRATGGGGYYLEGDRWGMIDPVASSIRQAYDSYTPDLQSVSLVHSAYFRLSLYLQPTPLRPHGLQSD